MRVGGARECLHQMKQYVERKAFQRLKEMLPLIFDSHGIFTREAQMELLMACSLEPIQTEDPWHQVTFAVPSQMFAEEEADSTLCRIPLGPM
jgi:hypothetical protein